MIHRITIEDKSPAAIIATLRAYVDRVTRNKALPHNEALSNDLPYVVGSAITYERKATTATREWR